MTSKPTFPAPACTAAPRMSACRRCTLDVKTEGEAQFKTETVTSQGPPGRVSKKSQDCQQRGGRDQKYVPQEQQSRWGGLRFRAAEG